jgi:hypothetical protein
VKRIDSAGFSLPEAITALLLVTILIQVSWGVTAAQRAATERLEDRIELLSARTMVRWILEEEVRAGLPGRDWQVPTGDSVALRAFRGWALVCPRNELTSPEEVVVCQRGIRSADSGKDSVLVLSGAGRWSAVRLARREVSHGVCPVVGGFREERWELDPPVSDAVLARVYERGAYFIRDGALRYRRGLSGRQPLTPQRIELRGKRLEPLVGGGFAWELESSSLDGRDSLAAWEGSARSLEGGNIEDGW